uniref:Uncharacterized protein n=1 Tax=Romanomermis culicivorax TaxID=13658 RepID=A0A915JD60_ROMCU
NPLLDGNTQAQSLPSTTASAPPTRLGRQPLGQSSNTTLTTRASVPAVSQIPLPSTAAQADIDPTMDCTDSWESFVNIDPRLAPAATHAPANDHHSSLAIANANKVHNFWLEARDDLEQFRTAAAQITNNVPMVQTID